MGGPQFLQPGGPADVTAVNHSFGTTIIGNDHTAIKRRIFHDAGLFAAGVQVTFDAPLGIVDLQSITGSVGIGAFDFDIPVIDNVLGFGTLDLLEDFLDPGVTGAGDDRVLLGTFTFLGLATGIVSIVAEDIPDLDTFLDGDGIVFNISAGGNDNGDITVQQNGNPVPEPASMMLLAPGCGRCYRLRALA